MTQKSYSTLGAIPLTESKRIRSRKDTFDPEAIYNVFKGDRWDSITPCGVIRGKDIPEFIKQKKKENKVGKRYTVRNVKIQKRWFWIESSVVEQYKVEYPEDTVVEKCKVEDDYWDNVDDHWCYKGQVYRFQKAKML